MAPPSPVVEASSRERGRARLRRLLFWVRRYLPAELAGTATMLVAGLGVAALGAPPVVVGLAGAQGENVGFYLVAGLWVWREQRHRFPALGRVRLALRLLKLMLLEFGPAELLDTLLLRPLFLTLAVHFVPQVAWALLVGKVSADIVFYVLAATAFRVTEVAGLRGDDPPSADDPR
ncbi:hypothetical protein ACFM35_08430 [Microbacterium sp. P01]|uniref:hypothetical protein n=1 Tax=Microbacterium sp. P01 TaxID=3366261 RepID=UPI003671E710